MSPDDERAWRATIARLEGIELACLEIDRVHHVLRVIGGGRSVSLSRLSLGVNLRAELGRIAVDPPKLGALISAWHSLEEAAVWLAALERAGRLVWGPDPA